MEAYPKCKYRHADNEAGWEAVVVADPEEEAQLGKGWSDSPPVDDADEPEEKPAKKKKA